MEDFKDDFRADLQYKIWCKTVHPSVNVDASPYGSGWVDERSQRAITIANFKLEPLKGRGLFPLY